MSLFKIEPEKLQHATVSGKVLTPQTYSILGDIDNEFVDLSKNLVEKLINFSDGMTAIGFTSLIKNPEDTIRNLQLMDSCKKSMDAFEESFNEFINNELSKTKYISKLFTPNKKGLVPMRAVAEKLNVSLDPISLQSVIDYLDAWLNNEQVEKTLNKNDGIIQANLMRADPCVKYYKDLHKEVIEMKKKNVQCIGDNKFYQLFKQYGSCTLSIVKLFRSSLKRGWLAYYLPTNSSVNMLVKFGANSAQSN